jgi:hypothetical protein
LSISVSLLPDLCHCTLERNESGILVFEKLRLREKTIFLNEIEENETYSSSCLSSRHVVLVVLFLSTMTVGFFLGLCVPVHWFLGTFGQ